jgi:hypothetical protein
LILFNLNYANAFPSRRVYNKQPIRLTARRRAGGEAQVVVGASLDKERAMHTTDADLPAEVSPDHLSPAERREAVAAVLASGLLRLLARPGACVFPDDSPGCFPASPVVKKPSESIKNTT